MTVNTNVLDFWELFVNKLIGDPILFLFVVLGVSAFALLKMKVPNEIFIVAMVSISAILSIYFRMPLLLIVLIFSLGFLGWMMLRIRRE